MPREKALTDNEKGKVMNIRCSGKSTDDIATALERSKNVVWTFMQAPEVHSKTKRSGRLPKVCAADKHILLREAHKGQKLAEQLLSRPGFAHRKEQSRPDYVQQGESAVKGVPSDTTAVS